MLLVQIKNVKKNKMLALFFNLWQKFYKWIIFNITYNLLGMYYKITFKDKV